MKLIPGDTSHYIGRELNIMRGCHRFSLSPLFVAVISSPTGKRIKFSPESFRVCISVPLGCILFTRVLSVLFLRNFASARLFIVSVSLCVCQLLSIYFFFTLPRCPLKRTRYRMNGRKRTLEKGWCRSFSISSLLEKILAVAWSRMQGTTMAT